MSGPFKATATDLHALAGFLTQASEISRETGIWLGPYGPIDVSIPGGSTVRVGVEGEGAEQQYVIDDRIGD